MKLLLKRMVLALALSSLLGGVAGAQSRTATVNLQKVFDKYWKTDQAIAVLRDRAADLDKTHREMVDGLKKAREEYTKLQEEASNQAVSPEERERRKRAAEAKLKSINDTTENISQFERQATTTLSEQKARMRKNILDEIKVAIASKAKAGGYSVVIDTGAQTYVADPTGAYYTPAILFASEDNDLTDAVISQMNAAAPVETPKAEEHKENSKGEKK